MSFAIDTAQPAAAPAPVSKSVVEQPIRISCRRRVLTRCGHDGAEEI